LIRSVTILEVLTRQQLAALVDHSPEFTNRAVEFSKNIKMDFALVRDIQGRAITLGDIVAHSVSVNSFGQILDHFETILGKPLRPLLAGAVDRWRTEIERHPPKPIILDFDVLKGRLSRLFEIRHILCHELPQKPAYLVNEVADFLDSAIQFSKAIEWVLIFEKHGLVPLTQTDMNIAAAEKLKDKQIELERLLADIRKLLKSREQLHAKFGSSENSFLSRLEDAQEKWTEYREANSNFVAERNRGGTIRPLVWAGEATRITTSRIAELRVWLEHESKL